MCVKKLTIHGFAIIVKDGNEVYVPDRKSRIFLCQKWSVASESRRCRDLLLQERAERDAPWKRGQASGLSRWDMLQNTGWDTDHSKCV